MGVIEVRILRLLWSRLRRAAVPAIPLVQGKIHSQKMLCVHKLPACGRGGMDAVKSSPSYSRNLPAFPCGSPALETGLPPPRPEPREEPTASPSSGLASPFPWAGPGASWVCPAPSAPAWPASFGFPASSHSPGLSCLLLVVLLRRDLLPLLRAVIFSSGRICRRCRFRLHGSQIGKQHRLQRCRTASFLLSPCRRDPFLHHSPGHGNAVLVSVSGDCRPSQSRRPTARAAMRKGLLRPQKTGGLPVWPV